MQGIPRSPRSSLLSEALLRFTLCAILALPCSNSWAASFEFVQAESEVVLAQLHTDGSDPFDHSNITDLTFTVEGDAIFGFGRGSYASTFDSTFAANRWTSDGFGGLTTVDLQVSGIFFDDTPPPSTALVDAQTPIFSLGLEPRLSSRMTLVDGTLPDFIEAHGSWRLVPEPASANLIAFLAVFFSCRGRPRQRLSLDETRFRSTARMTSVGGWTSVNGDRRRIRWR